MKRITEASQFKELMVIVTDLNGRFGINWITPQNDGWTTLEKIVVLACNESCKYGNLSVELPEEILEVIYLLLWRMASKVKVERKVNVFSHELGPSIEVKSLPDKCTEVTLLEPLKLDSVTAVLKVNYQGKTCILKMSSNHDKIEKEMKALHDLVKFDNIPSVLLSGEVIGHSCLLTTFMEGATLASLIRPVEKIDLLTIMTQLREFVFQLHLLGYSHCDLHPQNILWCSVMQKVHVIDFDYAQKASLNLLHQNCKLICNR